MRTTKSARSRNKARGTGSRSLKVNSARVKSRSSRLRVEQLEARVVPSGGTYQDLVNSIIKPSTDTPLQQLIDGPMGSAVLNVISQDAASVLLKSQQRDSDGSQAQAPLTAAGNNGSPWQNHDAQWWAHHPLMASTNQGNTNFDDPSARPHPPFPTSGGDPQPDIAGLPGPHDRPLAPIVSGNVLVNDPTQDGAFSGFTQSETTLLAWGGTNVLVGYNDSESFVVDGGVHFTGFSLSTNTGTSFTDLDTLPDTSGHAYNPGDAGDPTMARDNVTGRIYFATLDFNTFTTAPVFRSDDGGNTFQQPVAGITGGFIDKEWITVDNFSGSGQGNVYVTATDFGSGNGIVFSRSTDGGNSYSAPIQLASHGSFDVQGSDVVVGPDHAVYVFWFDDSAGLGGTEFIKMRKSTDQGLTFAPAVTVATLNTHGVNGDLGFNFRSNAFPRVAVNPVSGAIYVSYADFPNDGTGDRANIYFTQSTDGGNTWSSPVVVNDDGTHNDQFQPAIAVSPNGFQLFIGFYDRRLDPANSLLDTFGAIGDINPTTGAVSFEPNFRITNTSFPEAFGHDGVVNPSYMGDYDTAAADASGFYYTWGDNRLTLPDGVTHEPDVRFAQIITTLQVISTTPPVGSFVTTGPTAFTATFNSPINPSSPILSDITVNGQNPASDSVSADGLTLTVDFNTTPVTTEGPQSLDLAAGAVTRASDGSPLVAFNGTFYYDVDGQAFPDSSNPAPGGILNIPGDGVPGDPGTLAVHFTEAVQASSISTGNIMVSEGTVVGAFLDPSDPSGQTVDYQIGGPVTDGSTITVTGVYGTLNDIEGNPILTTSASYIVNVPISAYPVPLKPKSPLGSLIYDPSASGTIGFVGDTDSFTINLNAGQTATVLVTSDHNLQAQVQLFDPSNTLLGTGVAAGPGAVALLQTVAVNTAGTYTITISGANNTTGAFTATLHLNAAAQLESTIGPPGSDDTIATAQDLSSSFIDLGNGASRGAVLGSIPLPGPSFGDALAVEQPFSPGGGDVIQVNQTSGQIVNRFTSPAFSSLFLFDIALAADNTFYVLGDVNQFTGEIVHMDLQGNTLGTIISPVSDPGGFLSPEGFGLDPRDGSFWIPLVNSGNLLHIDANGNFLSENFVGGTPDDAAVGPDGNVYISQIFQNFIQKFDTVSQTTSFFASSNFPVDLTWDVSGHLWVGELFNGPAEFDQFGNQINLINDFGVTAGEPAPSTNVWDTNIFSSTVNQFTSSGSLLTQTSFRAFQPGLSVFGDVPNEAPLPAPDTSDYYSFTLGAGQSATIALTDLGAAKANLDLEDGSGNVLALGHVANTNVNQVINNFVAQTSGTYYIHVTGTGAKYSLVVTKNADFDTESHGSIATAQALEGGTSALGFAGLTNGANPGAKVLYFQDFTIGNNAFGNALTALGITPTLANSYSDFESKLAQGGWDLVILLNQDFFDQTWDAGMISYVQNGGRAIVDSWTHPADVAAAFGASWTFNDNQNSITQTVADPIWTNISNPFNLSNPGWFFFSFGMTATSGESIGTFGNGDSGLIVGNNRHTILNGFIQDTPANPNEGNQLAENEINALLITNDTDYYSVNANAGDNLNISTTTPFPGSGQFQNGLFPALNLYDPNGTLVASASGNAADGRNSQITYTTLLTGTYYVQVLASTLTPSPTSGEYTVSVLGATGGLPPFNVTTTNPAAGSFIRNEPTTLTVDFNDSILLTTLSASELTETVNGTTYTATGFTINNDREVTFTLPNIAGVTGDNVPIVFSIAAGASQDIQGTPLSAFTETVFVDTLPPRVIATSVEEGDVLSGNTLTYVATFSEPIDQATFSASSFDLHGNFRNADYAGTFSFDPTGTVLTITYSNVPDDSYKLTLFSSGITDFVGFHLDGEPHTPRPPSVPSGDGVEGGDFFIDFAEDTDTAVAIPVPLQAKPPLGSLVYDPSVTGVVAPDGDQDTYSISLNAGQTITVDATPDSNLQPHLLLYTVDSHGHKHILGHADASAVGAEAILQTIPAATEQTYYIEVSGLSHTQGLYHLQVTLNAALELEDHGGPSNSTIGMAQDLTNAFINVGQNGGSRAAVLGVADGSGNNILWVGPHSEAWNDGSVSVTHINLSQFATENFSGFNLIYVDANARDAGSLSILQSRAADVAAFVSAGGGLITDCGGAWYDPNFSWVPDSAGVSWVDDTQESISLTPLGQTHPIMAGITNAGLSSWGNSQHNDFSATAGLDVLATDPFGDPDVLSGNFGAGRIVYLGIDPSFHQENNSGQSRQLIRQAIHWAERSAISGGDFYAFDALAGESITLALAGLSGSGGLSMRLVNGSGDPLALSTGGATNLDAQIANFVARTDGTYYVQVTGNGGVKYDLVVTRDVAFDTENNNDLAHAQDITATVISPIAGGGALGTIFAPGGATLGANFDGLSFNDSTCGCSPPDGALAVGDGYVMEGVNTVLRISTTAGVTQLTQNFSDFFAPIGPTQFLSDPYIVFDDIAQRWYVTILDVQFSFVFDDILFAVSNDANPLDGFSLQERIHVGSSDLIDFQKVGFNADAIVITGNDFNSSGTIPLQGVSIDKTALLSGTFTDYLWQRPGFPDHFRAEVPAWMHGSMPGDPMYLVEEAGYGNGTAARVVTMTNILSSNPTFVDTDIPVNPYGFPGSADQPGGFVNTNDTTFTRADWRNGLLVSDQNASEPGGDAPSHVHWYEFSTAGTPSLVQQGIIDPGPGISTYYGSMAIDANGDLGMTYMESSTSEFVSMYVTGQLAGAAAGTMAPGTLAVAGNSFLDGFFRAGDYAGIAVDPANGTTFWAENEYKGNAFWNTYVASFQILPPADEDWYTVNTNEGDQVTVSVEQPLPGGGQFVDAVNPVFDIIDPNGNVVATGVTGLTFDVGDDNAGLYAIRVHVTDGSTGEYVLDVSGATGGLPDFHVTAATPAAGVLIQPPPSITVDFNHSIYFPSVSASDLTDTFTFSDGSQITETATSFTIVNDHEVIFLLPAQPGPQDDRVDNFVQIVGGNIQDISGQTLDDFGYHFTTDNLPPTVVGTSIEEGDTVAGPNFSYVVTFSEPMLTAFTTASSFDLHGNFLNADYAPSSFGFDATGTILTINYTNLPDDQYTETLFGTGFEDLVGLQLEGTPHTPRPPSVPSGGVPGSNFFVDFTLDNDATFAIPVPLSPVNPPGGLIYEVSGAAAPVKVNVFSGFTFNGGGAPYSGLVGSLATQDIKFATSTGFNWHPFGLFQFGADMTGGLKVAADGTYTFTLNSDDGSLLFIDGSLVVNDGGLHAPVTVSGSTFLRAGLHSFEVQFFEAFGGASGVDLSLPAGVSYVTLAPVTGVLAPVGDTDNYSINVDPGQTITVYLQAANLQGTLTLTDPNGTVIGTAISPAVGTEAVIQTAATTVGGTYTITVGDASGSVGLYHLQVILNAAVQMEQHGGPSDDTIATAQDLTGSSVPLGSHGADRLAVIGKTDVPSGGGFVGPDPFGYEAIPVTPTFTDISSDPSATAILQFTDDSGQYVPFSGLNASFQFSMYGQTYSASSDPLHNHMYINTDGWMTFEYNESFYFYGGDLKSYPTSAAIAPMWNDTIFIGPAGAVYYEVINPTGTDPQLVIEWKNVQAFYAPGTGFTYEIVLDQNTGHIQFNYQSIAYGTYEDNGAVAGVGIKGFGFGTPNELTVSFRQGPNAFINSFQSTLIGVNVAPQGSDYYSFALAAGQTATIALTDLSSLQANVDIEDASGTVLATGVSGNTNISQVINNFTAATAGTYYVHVTGNAIPYDLVITRSATFEQEPHNSQAQAQDITNTGGALGAIVNPGTIQVGTNFDGLSFNDTTCGCSPPDGALAVANGFVVEGVNTAIRISDTSGNNLLTEEFSQFFAPVGPTQFLSDPYIVYDDIANRWYVIILDVQFSFAFDDLLFAVSNDSNPLDGFSMQERIHFGATDLVDFPKMGFNADAIVITGNDFNGSGDIPLEVIAIDKTALLSGTFIDYLSQRTPGFPNHFRAEVPAEMHGSMPGDPMFLVEEAGYGNGTAARVVTMTNILTPNPTFTDTDIPVNTYSFPASAQQPGGFVNTNDTTFSHADWRNGMLVTAQNVSEPDDGFSTSRVRWYEFSTSGTPSLVQEGTINPGPGISTYYGSLALDNAGNIAMTYMESSASEFVSMYVTGRGVNDPLGTMKPGVVVAPGNSFLEGFFRAGDYSGIGLDPTTGKFWAENEYKGNAFWNTFVASFQVAPPPEQDWYSVNLTSGETLNLATSTPADGPGEFVNTLDPHIVVQDANGNVVATGTDGPDGRNETLSYSVPTGINGTYYIVVTGDNGTQGEYYLDKTVQAAAQISGRKFEDVNGSGVDDPSDPGLPNWTIDLVDSTGTVVETATTDANGNYLLTGVAPGTYTVQEVLQSGWVQDYPQPVPPGTYTVTVAAGDSVSGEDFGNYQPVIISGRKFNDLNASGVDDPSDPGVPGWTIELLNSSGTVVDSKTTDPNGNYTFAEVPGTYVIEEVLQSGWVQTYPQPVPPGSYTVTLTSGQSSTGDDFGNYQPVTISGRKFNDLNGSGVDDPSDPGLSGWTIELLNSSGTVVDSKITDSNGNYTFTEVPGTYTVEEVNQTGWTQTFPTPIPPGSYTLTLTSGQPSTGDDFGNFQNVTVSGTVFNDLDDNLVQDPGEPGIANVTMNLDGVAMATTDANGNYTITGVGPGPHVVSEVIPSAYIATFPGSGSAAFIPSSGSNQTQNFADALPTATRDNGTDGYREFGGNWSTLAQGWNGTSRTHAATTSAGVYAVWPLTLPRPGIPPGRYEVFVTWVPGSDRDTRATYQIYDGTVHGVLRATVRVDQTQTPGDATYQGVVWKSLGTYDVTHGRVTIKLLVSSRGSVDADGVLIIPAGSISAPVSHPHISSPSASAAPATLTQSQPLLVTSAASGSTSTFLSSLPPSRASATPAQQQLLATIFAATNQPASSPVVVPGAGSGLKADNRSGVAGGNVPASLLADGRPTTYRAAVDSAFSLVHHSSSTSQWDDLVDFLAQNQVGNGKRR